MGKTEVCSGFRDVRFFCVRVFDFEVGFMCSGCTGFVWNIMTLWESSDKVDFVEKMWRNLRKSLWANCGKVLRRTVEKVVLHILGRRFARFGRICGKFCRGFAQGFNRGRGGVLHIFHIDYYYNY